MLSARDLEHRYGERRVLSLDALDLEPGTSTALVGPNGSGKSTLLRILAFLEPPTRGVLRLDGRPIAGRAERQRARTRVTLVEQTPILFDGSVERNLAYALKLHGVRGGAAAARGADALGRLGLAGLLLRDARSLSSGERQMVAVARALALRPAVLLLDEPVSAADRAAAAQFYRVLEEERARGMTLCFASHQLEEAYRWSDRLIALAEGCASPVTPENLFRTTIPPGDGPRVVHAGPLEIQVITDRTGPATIAISPTDIVVSREPLHSSARNQFIGRVSRVSEDGRGGVSLMVDVGVELAVRITRGALDDLGITLGASVVLSVKAVAIKVF